MAMSDPQKPAASASSQPRTPATREGAPAWVVPLYVGGLILFYIGERVLSTMETGRWIASGLGLSSVLAATAMRFIPTWQAGGERGRIERLLGILSVIGVVALGVYLASTDGGLDKLGFAQATDEKRSQVKELLTVAYVVLIMISVVPMLFAEAALYPMRNAERLESRRVRAAAGSGLVLALAAIYGSLFVYVASGTEWKVDFSYFKTSEPSESTRKLLQGLGDKITVTAFFPETSPVRKEVQGYLNSLAKGAPSLKVEVADRYLSPKLARDMKVVQDGTIVISKGDAKRTVFIGTEMKDAQKKLKTLDRDFQERLFKLLREQRTVYQTVGHGEINDEERGVDTAEGRSAHILKELLGKQHYLVKTLGLSQGLANDVPDDADIVMVLGPTQPLSPEEIASLKRYADRGGKLFLALDPDAVSAHHELAEGSPTEAQEEPAAENAEGQPTTPASSAAPTASAAPAKSAAPKPEHAEAPKKGDKTAAPHDGTKSAPAAGVVSATTESLRALADIVGVTFTPTILANDQQYVRRRYNDSDRTLLVTNRFSSHASVSTLSRNSSRAAVLVSGAGMLEKAQGSTAKTDMAIRALASTFADDNGNYRADDQEKRDSYGIAAAVSKPPTTAPLPPKDDKKNKPKEKDPSQPPDVATPNEMRAFVLADADALTDLLLSNFMTNQLLIVDAVRWLGGEESFAGEVNTEEDVRIEHTQQKDLVWFYTTIFGAPALVLALGLTYSRRSRNPRPRRS